MTALANPGHLALLEEYRLALELWSEARALYARDALEVAEATRQVEELERRLKAYRD